ncbi:hypothetical protein DSO57_1039743 [Entomophthora muscae]|uniref:Uncharacterized protein n=1 Tax=Entomophthora muscae TaxID=34485 RepID=A0ACC2TV25_9FUNG|nr:hypothetical protein DSO57_1039743 [Entomophthora muscae]
MEFLEEELVLAFQEKKEWLDELDAQRALLDSLQDQLSKHLEDASAISTPDTLMGLHGNAKDDSSPSQKILTTLPLPDSHHCHRSNEEDVSFIAPSAGTLESS